MKKNLEIFSKNEVPRRKDSVNKELKKIENFMKLLVGGGANITIEQVDKQFVYELKKKFLEEEGGDLVMSEYDKREKFFDETMKDSNLPLDEKIKIIDNYGTDKTIDDTDQTIDGTDQTIDGTDQSVNKTKIEIIDNYKNRTFNLNNNTINSTNQPFYFVPYSSYNNKSNNGTVIDRNQSRNPSYPYDIQLKKIAGYKPGEALLLPAPGYRADNQNDSSKKEEKSAEKGTSDTNEPTISDIVKQFVEENKVVLLVVLILLVLSFLYAISDKKKGIKKVTNLKKGRKKN